MKIEIDDSQLINDIVEKVVERITPLLNNSHNSNDNELMDVKGLAAYLNVNKQWVYEKTHLSILTLSFVILRVNPMTLTPLSKGSFCLRWSVLESSV